MTDNRKRCLSGIDTSVGCGLEIGPLDRPLLPRSPGRIFSADHTSTEALRKKYASDPVVSTRDICEIDFDLSNTPLSRLAHGSFDYVVASHVIEHVPDIVTWLRDIQSILRVGGCLALVVPDRRFTFDYFRRESTLWMVQEAIGRQRPDAEIVLDYLANVVSADASKLWADPPVAQRELRKIYSAAQCSNLIARHSGGEYIDVHCWVFTPASFRELILEMIEANGLSLKLSLLEPTFKYQLDFHAQLTKI